MKRIFLTDRDTIVKDCNNLVNITLADGTKFEHVEPRRMFPVSAPSDYLTFLDEDGVEMCVVKSISDLNEDSRNTVLSSLADYYLVPTIKKILKREDKYGILRYVVETERGEYAFDVRNRGNSIRPLPDGSVRIRDSNDNRYLIKSIEGLDAKSRALLIEDM